MTVEIIVAMFAAWLFVDGVGFDETQLVSSTSKPRLASVVGHDSIN